MTASAFAKPLCPTLTCHAWNGDGTQVAVSPNNEEIHVYEASSRSPSGWERVHVLSQHEQAVSALDWAPGSGQLLSCSHDRNAFVWTLQLQHDGGGGKAQWVPEMVIIKHDRAALAVRWSPCERKFAVGSGAKSVCVCHFDRGLNWWGSSVVRRKHGSSVVAVAWHPSSTLLATASTDFKCRVFNARVPGIDGPGPGGAFGDLVYEVDCGGCWAHGVAWSPSGASLAVSTHRSSVILAEGFPCVTPAANEEQGGAGTPLSVASSAVTLRSLPLKSVLFLSDGLIVGAGFDGQLVLIGRKDKSSSAAKGNRSGGGGVGSWAVLQTLSSSSAAAAERRQKAGGETSAASSSSSSALSDRIRMFQPSKEQPGSPVAAAAPSGTPTKAAAAAGAAIHSDTVVELRRVPGPQGHGSSAHAALVSSCGLDGRIGVWDLSSWTD